jgi:hypothetical protein
VSRLAGIASVGLVLVFVLFFARWNGAERVTLDLGLWTFYRVPITWVAFVSLLLGMGVMLLAGLHADLRVRKFLRDRLAAQDEDSRRPEVDRLQQDLFTPVSPAPVGEPAPVPAGGVKPRPDGAPKPAIDAAPKPGEASTPPTPAHPRAGTVPASEAPTEPPSAPSHDPAPVPGDERTEAPPPP